jgi:hypothetical protein
MGEVRHSAEQQGDAVELPWLHEAVFFMATPVQMIFTSSVEGPGPAVVDPQAPGAPERSEA